MIMTNKQALEILEKAFRGRKDKKGYPDFDDINTALDTVSRQFQIYEDRYEEGFQYATKLLLQVEGDVQTKLISIRHTIEQKLRHEICEGIRENAKPMYDKDLHITGYFIYVEKLDQIEGKSK